MDYKIVSSNSQSGNCYYIEYAEDRAMLLDIGCTYKKLTTELGKKRIAKIDTVYVSHVQHGDHWNKTTVKQLINNSEKIINIIANDELIDSVIESLVTMQDKLSGNWELQSKNDSLVVEFIELAHFNSISKGDDGKTKCPCYGADITTPEGRILFITDTGYYEPSEAVLNACYDLVLLECNYRDELLNANENLPYILKERIRRSHLSLRQYNEVKNKLSYDTIAQIHKSKGNL